MLGTVEERKSDKLQQSPIDIRETKEVELPDLRVNYNTTDLRIVNNGHTLEVIYDPGSYLIYEDRVYELIQFHFHTPSEHLIKGRSFPMEIHIVHKSEDGELLVVGIMMKEGKPNELLEELWRVLPLKDGKEKFREDIKINATNLFPSNKDYYTYTGSLTTPPYTEGVRWIVMKTPTEISKEQVNRFRSLFGENARDVQPLYSIVLEKKNSDS